MTTGESQIFFRASGDSDYVLQQIDSLTALSGTNQQEPLKAHGGNRFKGSTVSKMQDYTRLSETQAGLQSYYVYDGRWIEWERNLCQPLPATYQLWRGLQQRSAWPERGPVVWLWCRAVLSRTRRKREGCGRMRCTASGTRGCWPAGWPAEWSASAAARGGPTPASTAAPGGHKRVNTSHKKKYQYHHIPIMWWYKGAIRKV